MNEFSAMFVHHHKSRRWAKRFRALLVCGVVGGMWPSAVWADSDPVSASADTQATTAPAIEAPAPTLSQARAQALRPIKGLWVWQKRWTDDLNEQERLLDFCDDQGFNLLLVQIHTRRANDATRKVAYAEAFERLIQASGRRGIAVEALDGGPRQASAKKQASTLAILQAILAFNAQITGEHRLSGVHYDIEPYGMPGWKETQTRQVIMHDLVTFYDRAKQAIAEDPFASGMGFTLSCDIPMSYDSMGEKATLTFKDKSANLHEHVQDLCDYIGIMSYRTQATGPNSVSEQIAGELAYAESIGSFVCGALETLKLPKTPQITFHGKPVERFHETLDAVQSEHAQRSGYGGTLIHCYGSARQLLGEETEPSP